jgi:hypothetical protein
MNAKNIPVSTNSAAASLLQACATKEAVLSLLSRNQITVEMAMARLAELEPKAAPRRIHFKVSEKGAVSVYGLQRMPVTLYVQQWECLLDDETIKRLKQFIADNSAALSRK